MDIEKYNKSFVEYVKGRGKETEYYIITAKLGEEAYKLTLLRNHFIIMESYYAGLTVAKFGAFEWLLNHDSSIFEMNKVTMVHYKEDRPNGNPWVKDTDIELHKNLESYFRSSAIKPETINRKDVSATKEIRQTRHLINIEKQLIGEETKVFVVNSNLEEYVPNTYQDMEVNGKLINTWFFQGNPSVFDIDNYVTNNKYIWWSLRQEHFVDKIQLNDDVFLWRSDGGKRGTGGIIAKCKIVSLPLERADDSNSKDYWHTDDWENPYLAVKLEVLDVRLEEGLISRLSLLEHPVLKELLILRLRQQTNYLLSPEHAIVLQKLWEYENDSIQNNLKDNIHRDIELSVNREITETEKEQVIKSRIGQSTFKKALLNIEKKCRLCGVSDERFLVASHIKPWSQSNHQERLDANNGLLLCPNHDSLFDKGFISFNDDGSILISDSLEEATKVFLNINESISLEMNDSQRQLMKWHRENIYHS